MPRKKHDPATAQPKVDQRALVQTMAGYGVPQDDIARIIGVDPKTMRLHYRDELDRGATLANSKVAEALYKVATATDAASGRLIYRNAVTAQIFWLKTRAGWSEYTANAPPPPPPKEAKDAPLGKKEQAELDALTAADGTSWEDLVKH